MRIGQYVEPLVVEPGSNPKTLNDFVELTLYGEISCSVKSPVGEGGWSCLKDVGTVDFSGEALLSWRSGKGVGWGT